MSPLRGRSLGAACALVLLACAAPPEAGAPPRVSVEVYRGLPPPPAWTGSAAVSFHLVLDATLSMRRLAAPDAAPGVRRIDAARLAAERALRAIPPRRGEVGVRVLGAAEGGACPEAVPLRAPAGAAPASALGPALRTLPPRSEGSLGAALAGVASELRDRGTEGRRGARVVVVSDLERGCGPDPCAAAAELAALGAAIEVVAIGGGEVPPCLAEPPVPAEPPAALAGALAERRPPPVRVEQRDATGEQVATASGRADGAALTARAGKALLAVDLDPVEWVGPLDLAPGSHTRVRILDFPGAEPPARSVHTEQRPAAAVAEPASAREAP